ncbi:hypothetical protein SAMN06298216_4064 [Spirosomataceae bacterium TFI 002]|nr:hypothetical protein SAMN06298216_4064 [Spirosomataceae bacterium TFI 002]
MLKQIPYLLLAFLYFQSCTSSQYLQNSKSSFSLTDQGSLLKFTYEEEFNELGHLASPWATNTYAGKGSFWLGKASFYKHDTLLSNRGRTYFSKTQWSDDTLLYLDYGDEQIMGLTADMHLLKLINTAKYSPTVVYKEFLKRAKETKVETKDKQAVYTLKMGSYKVNLAINTSSQDIDFISYLSYDELYGDVNTTFSYTGYQRKEGVSYPTAIKVEKINAKAIDLVNVISVEKASPKLSLLEKPTDYQLIAPTPAKAAKITVAKYNDYIHLIDLEHTDDKVLVVEFDDYMLVAEAPINPANGELIITEVKKIAPTKPIKYFVFGHHHPHYLGGLRAFVHKGATIICTEMSENYVTTIANAPHTLQPDKLEKEPIELKTQVVKDSLEIGENVKMKIYFIGEKSAHTYDYLIYYFPQDQLLFQDDLCWIAKDGPITKAGSRQVGLYNSILELNLKVDTIIQSWPVNDHKVKTIIPFSDLEKSVLMEK